VGLERRPLQARAFYGTIAAATLLGVPLGVCIGWSRNFSRYASALLGMLRPVPPLAWVPLAILIFAGSEAAVIFVTFLVAFFATTLNTAVGVKSIDPDFWRAAACLGASRRDILVDVVLPGAAAAPGAGARPGAGSPRRPRGRRARAPTATPS